MLNMVQRIQMIHRYLNIFHPLILRHLFMKITSPLGKEFYDFLLSNIELKLNFSFRISLRWFFNDRTYICPEICSLSLLSSIHVIIEARGVSISPSLIESCDFRARHPFTNYFQTRRLISRG